MAEEITAILEKAETTPPPDFVKVGHILGRFPDVRGEIARRAAKRLVYKIRKGEWTGDVEKGLHVFLKAKDQAIKIDDLKPDMVPDDWATAIPDETEEEIFQRLIDNPDGAPLWERVTEFWKNTEYEEGSFYTLFERMKLVSDNGDRLVVESQYAESAFCNEYGRQELEHITATLGDARQVRFVLPGREGD